MSHHQILTRLLRVTLASIPVLLASCGAIEISGRVVSGPAGIPIVVPATDRRVEEGQGVDGVLIEVTGESGERLASSHSDPLGRFELAMPATGTPTGAVQIQASGSTILPAKGTIYLPRDGSWIIFNVKPNPVGPAGDASR